MQEYLGKVALPTIDWASAGTLASMLGREGVEEQLALLGIQADGRLHDIGEQPEHGILSRRQADAVALISLLLTILVFIYQEYSSQQDKANNAELQSRTAAMLQAQTLQLQSLGTLILQALAQAAEAPEPRLVVRERVATVRDRPEHGSSMEGKLLPNEVVLAVGRKGQWVQVEYYHWLHEEYRTGWVLKRYLQRVPSSHVRGSSARCGAPAGLSD